MSIELRNADQLPDPVGYSHISIASPGRLVHLAGQIGTDADGSLVDGLTNQTEMAIRNMLTALEASGATTADLAKITIYVVGFNESKQGELFAGMGAATASAPLPLVPITLVGVQSLFLDAALIEIEATAVLAD